MLRITGFSDQKNRQVAAVILFFYLLVQGFQFYIFATSPSAETPAERLIREATDIHLWRSFLLLISFFLMIHVFLVICSYNLNYNFTLTACAFIGLFSFCFLEILIRSVELFYIQHSLPGAFVSKGSDKENILMQYTLFQSVQYALYFPLMLTQAIGSTILAFKFSNRRKINILINIAFGINAIRLGIRLLGMYLEIDLLNRWSFNIYLPAIITIFGLMIAWLLRVKEESFNP